MADHLECIEYAPTGPEQPIDIILVHGISSGAWMWEPDLIAPFTDAGYRTWALSLSGHGNSAGRDRLNAHRLATYADDIAKAMDNTGRPVALLAHSLGGAAAQKLLASGAQPAGTALLCSVPPYGLWRASMEMFWRHPRLWHEMGKYSLFGLPHVNIGVVRDGLFPGGIADARFDGFLSKLQNESLAAMMDAMGWPPFAPGPLSQDNLLVIGGSRDRFVPLIDTYMTAAYYRAPVHILQGAGHMPMYEDAGRAMIPILLDWLGGISGQAVLAA
ncbi:MAG: alpha/beta hydrolase [Marinibacterium sp.]|nr:alpha/beta hydrolase [Marinibacterium sp.]